jgi:hypothetical protein
LGLQTSIIVRRIAIAAALTLPLAAWANAQTSQEPRSLNIVLLGGVPSEQVHITYYLYGSFGAYGGVTTPKPGAPSYQIPTFVNGKAARHVKGFVFAYGCSMALFDITLIDAADVQQYFSCSPLGTITLLGRIRSAELQGKEPLEVRFDYVASWACRFFGLADCAVPQIEIGRVTPDVDGAFEIELPNFKADPISSDSAGGAELQVVLREIKTWNLAAFLEPETEALRASGRTLKIVPSYPQNLLFLARKTH